MLRPSSDTSGAVLKGAMTGNGIPDGGDSMHTGMEA